MESLPRVLSQSQHCMSRYRESCHRASIAWSRDRVLSQRQHCVVVTASPVTEPTLCGLVSMSSVTEPAPCELLPRVLLQSQHCVESVPRVLSQSQHCVSCYHESCYRANTVWSRYRESFHRARIDGPMCCTLTRQSALAVVVVAFSSLARIWGECSTIHPPPRFFFFKWRLARAH